MYLYINIIWILCCSFELLSYFIKILNSSPLVKRFYPALLNVAISCEKALHKRLWLNMEETSYNHK